MFLRTERLLLRPAWPEDVDDFVAMVDADLLQDRSETPSAYPLPATPAVLRQSLVRNRDRNLPHLFINLRMDRGMKLIGGIGLSRDKSEVELRYFIGRAYRGMGFAREAVSAFLAQAWLLGHSRVIALHFDGNAQSRRTLAGVGFRNTDETRMRWNPTRGMDIPAKVRAAVRPRGLQAGLA